MPDKEEEEEARLQREEGEDWEAILSEQANCEKRSENEGGKNARERRRRSEVAAFRSFVPSTRRSMCIAAP